MNQEPILGQDYRIHTTNPFPNSFNGRLTAIIDANIAPLSIWKGQKWYGGGMYSGPSQSKRYIWKCEDGRYFWLSEDGSSYTWEEIKETPDNHGARWTTEEENKLRELAALSNNEPEHIGRLMGRTAVAIRDRAYRLGLTEPFNSQKPYGFEWKKNPYKGEKKYHWWYRHKDGREIIGNLTSTTLLGAQSLASKDWTAICKADSIIDGFTKAANNDKYDTEYLTTEREDKIFKILSGKPLSVSQSQLLLTLD